MNRLRTATVLIVLLLAAALLVAFLPARWMVSTLEARLHGLRLAGVSGSLWQGHAERLLAVDGTDLGQLDWQLSRHALLGDTRLSVHLAGPLGSFSADMQQLDAQRMEWRGLQLEGDLAALRTHMMPAGSQLRGALKFEGKRLVLQGRWPVEVDAQAQWADAGLQAQGRELTFGNLQLQAQGQGGVVQGSLQDDGKGPLQVDGQFMLSPLGWRYDIAARPRSADPALRRWLAGFGPLTADNTLHLQRHGGLAAPAPAQGTP